MSIIKLKSLTTNYICEKQFFNYLYDFKYLTIRPLEVIKNVKSVRGHHSHRYLRGFTKISIAMLILRQSHLDLLFLLEKSHIFLSNSSCCLLYKPKFTILLTSITVRRYGHSHIAYCLSAILMAQPHGRYHGMTINHGLASLAITY